MNVLALVAIKSWKMYVLDIYGNFPENYEYLQLFSFEAARYFPSGLNFKQVTVPLNLWRWTTVRLIILTRCSSPSTQVTERQN